MDRQHNPYAAAEPATSYAGRRTQTHHPGHATGRWGGPTVTSTPRPVGNKPAGSCTTTPSNADRVAGLLVLLYARPPPPSATSPSTTSSPDERARCIRLGESRRPSPTPLDQMVREPSPKRRRRRPMKPPGCSPAGDPDAPERLPARRTTAPTRRPTRRARSAALFQTRHRPARRHPGRTLGIHISVATAWQRASAATGPTTPPKSAAEHTAKERHSDSCNI